jgi:ABC-type dipeptide/oligopeptide/nickel transport system permease subunit
VVQEENTTDIFSGIGVSIKKRSFVSRIFVILRAVLENSNGKIGITFITALVLSAVFSPWIAPYDPYKLDMASRFMAPSFRHLLGTDNLGRDILSRLIYGSRIAVMVSFGSVSLSAILGTVLGVAAGYKEGKKVDYVVIWLFDIVRSFPQIILALAIVAVLGPSLINLIIALAFTAFPFYGRVARAQTLTVKEMSYVKAAEALGAENTRIIFKHIIPNILSPVIVLVGMDMATMIMYEAGLSFLGLGVNPPTASWGIMLRNGYTYIETSVWMIIWPSIAIAISMIGFSLFTESVRIALSPKERDIGG